LVLIGSLWRGRWFEVASEILFIFFSVFLGGLAGWVYWLRTHKMLHGWTNRTFRARDGVSGALGGMIFFSAYALFTFLYDGYCDGFSAFCDVGPKWIMSALEGLRNTCNGP
jgi:hypothetical protein